MKFTLGLIIFLTAFSQQPQVSEMRDLYKNAADEEKAAERLLKFTENKNAEDPLSLGYHAVAYMMMAKHVGNPLKKLSYFNKGKDIFTAAIEADAESPELRFLRFTVQAETPDFLNYKQNMEEDKRLLLSKVSGLRDGELRGMILRYLRSSKELNESEKRNL